MVFIMLFFKKILFIFTLCPGMWPVLINNPSVLEKSMHFLVVEYRQPYKSIRSSLLIIFRFFYIHTNFLVWSVTERGMLSHSNGRFDRFSLQLDFA